MTRREFQLIEGTSKKFWAISLDGTAHEVHFGRIGTLGQTSRKEFATELEARASHDKLIAEKLRKGYTEVEGSTPAGGPGPVTPERRPTTTMTAKAEPALAAEAASPTPEAALGPLAVPVTSQAPLRTAERCIALAVEDWQWATWRPRTPRPRLEARPFDLEDCLGRLVGKKRDAHARWAWNLEDIPPVMSRQEAHFWLVALTSVNQKLQPDQFVARLRVQDKTFDGKVGLNDAIRLMSGNMTFTPEQVVLPLMTLLPTDGWLDVCQASLGPAGYMASYVILRLVDGFRHHALPFLTDAELEVIRGKLRARLGPPGYPSDPYQTFPFACHLAAATGMHEEILAIVRTIPDDLYVGPNWGDHYHRPQDLIFGLALKQA